jgi:hypothetical protein
LDAHIGTAGAHLLVPGLPRPVQSIGVLADRASADGWAVMEYKQFIVKAFERAPGKWRASVERANGKVIMATLDRPKLAKFVTGVDAKSAQVAMLMALAAIDAGAFSKHLEIGDDEVG